MKFIVGPEPATRALEAFRHQKLSSSAHSARHAREHFDFSDIYRAALSTQDGCLDFPAIEWESDDETAQGSPRTNRDRTSPSLSSTKHSRDDRLRPSLPRSKSLKTDLMALEAAAKDLVSSDYEFVFLPRQDSPGETFGARLSETHQECIQEGCLDGSFSFTGYELDSSERA